MGYVNKPDHVTNPYSISRWHWKLTKKLFSHLLHLTIPNSSVVASTKETTLIGRVSDVVRPERGPYFVA
jgi:hypothetical protein